MRLLFTFHTIHQQLIVALLTVAAVESPARAQLPADPRVEVPSGDELRSTKNRLKPQRTASLDARFAG